MMVAYSHGEIVPSFNPLTAPIVTRGNDPDSLSTVRVAIWIGASWVLSLVIDGDAIGRDWLIASKDGVLSISKCEPSGAECV